MPPPPPPPPPPTFTVDIKTEHICSNIAKYVETRIDTKNYKLFRPLPQLKSNKVIYLMKVELLEKIKNLLH